MKGSGEIVRTEIGTIAIMRNEYGSGQISQWLNWNAHAVLHVWHT